MHWCGVCDSRSQPGEVDLSESAIEISLYIANLTEVTLNYNSSLDDETDFEDVNMTQGTYGMKFVDQVHTNEILDPGEIVRMYVMVNRTTHEVSANDRLMIVIISSVAMIKVTKNCTCGY